MDRRTVLKGVGLFSAGLVLPSLSTSCNSRQTAISSSTATPLIVGVQPWIGFRGHYVATAKNLFAPEGVAVKEEFFQVATDTNTALASGKVDLAWIGGPDLLTLVAQSPSLRIIMVSDYSNGADGIIGRNISKPEQLRGKKVAREDAPYAIVFLGEYLKRGGLTEKDVEVTPLSASDAVAAFASGKIDAATTYEPWLSKAAQEAQADIIFTSKGTNIIPIVLATRTEVIESRRDDILKYLKSIDKAIAFADSNPEEAAEICAQKLGVTPKEIPAQLSGIVPFDIAGNKAGPFDANSPLNLKKSLESASQTIYQLGVISKPIDATTLIDDSLIKAL
jgi:NitT/TauT family transport system substrate-binding protein